MNWFDYSFLSFLFIFVVIATIRGFVKELFSLLNVALSITASIFLSPIIIKFISKLYQNKILVNAFTQISVFVIVLIILSILTANIRNDLKEKLPLFIDRSLGILYAILKTVFIFSMVISVAIYINFSVMLKKTPDWVSKSKFADSLAPSVKYTDKLLFKIIDIFNIEFNDKGEIIKYIKEINEKLNNNKIEDKKNKSTDKSKENNSNKLSGFEIDPKVKESFNKINDRNKKLNDLEKNIETKEEKNSGYDKKEIKKMDRLIEIID